MFDYVIMENVEVFLQQHVMFLFWADDHFQQIDLFYILFY